MELPIDDTHLYLQLLHTYAQQLEHHDDHLDLKLSLAPPLPRSLRIPNPAIDPSPSSSSTPNPIPFEVPLFPSPTTNSTSTPTAWSPSLSQLLVPSLSTPCPTSALSISPSSTPNSTRVLFSSSTDPTPNPTSIEVSWFPPPTTNPTPTPTAWSLSVSHSFPRSSLTPCPTRDLSLPSSSTPRDLSLPSSSTPRDPSLSLSLTPRDPSLPSSSTPRDLSLPWSSTPRNLSLPSSSTPRDPSSTPRDPSLSLSLTPRDLSLPSSSTPRNLSLPSSSTPNPTIDLLSFSSNLTPNPTIDLLSFSSNLTPNPTIDLLSFSSNLTPNPTIDLLSFSSNLTPNPIPVEVSQLPSPTTNPTHSSTSRSPSPTAPTRWRRQLQRSGKSNIIPAPYPWAKNRRATIYNLEHLHDNEIFKIVGTMKCRKCEEESEVEYDLMEKFKEVEGFIESNVDEMFNRAPGVWNDPMRQDCLSCDKKHCVGALIGKKRDINWLFLFLGQMVGFCSLKQLKYFCKHTRNHQTGSRNRLLYITYLSLYKQLNPNARYDP